MRMVILGLPPTTNNLYAIVGGRQVKVEAGRVWTSIAAAVARDAWGDRPPSDAPFAVLITYHRGAYDRDVDGSHKTLIDGFAPKGEDGVQTPIIWHDDRQLVLFAARKVRAPKGVLPYVSIVVRELSARPPYRPVHPVRQSLTFETNRIPPSTNNTYTTWRGRRRKSKDARDAFTTYLDGFATLAAKAPRDLELPLEGPVRVRLRHGYRADRRDVDGSHKLLFDAARGAAGAGGLIWRDDLQITSLSIAKGRMPAALEPHICGDVRPLVSPAVSK